MKIEKIARVLMHKKKKNRLQRKKFKENSKKMDRNVLNIIKEICILSTTSYRVLVQRQGKPMHSESYFTNISMELVNSRMQRLKPKLKITFSSDRN